MNTATTYETAAIAAATELIALHPAQRAVVALDSTKIEAELRALVAKTASITAVLDPAGREQAHRAAMDLKNTRVAITSTGKKAREDATAFSNAVIAEEKRLIAISSPEETRLFALRDGWDAKIEAERQAKLEAERGRVQSIADAIGALRRNETEAARCRTAADIQALINSLEAHTITEAIYHERKGEAELVKAEVLATLQSLHTTRAEAEATELRAKQEREAEAARLAEERAELARLRAEAAERDRVAADAKRQLDEQAAKLAAERLAIEAERAAAQAVAAKPAAAEQPQVTTQCTGDALDAATEIASQPLQPAAPQPTTPPAMKLGEITERLGFVVTAVFLESLGFAPAATEKSAKLYHHADFPAMCSAIIRHIREVRDNFNPAGSRP